MSSSVDALSTVALSSNPSGKKKSNLSSKKTQSQGVQLLPLILKSVKTGGALLSVWLVGYYGLNLTWVLGALCVYVGQKEYRRSKADKTAAIAAAEEEEAVLARVDELPSWVYFPDVERAEWLNKMIQQMWPFISAYAKNLMETTIQSAVNENLPPKLTPFKFENIDLGNIPPRIGGVKVYIENIKRDEIIMDLEITCTTDADITVSVRGFRAGIRDFMLHGTVRVVMTPLVNKIPIIGGLSVFFLSQPQIDFDLTNAANFLDIPLLSTSLRTVILDQVSNFVVLPNKIPITIIDNVEKEVQYPLPQGVLRVHVYEASTLKKADVGFGGKGKSDPYCRVIAGGVSYDTKVIDNTVSPQWNETFEFVIAQRQGQVISFEVYDEDPGDDDRLGNVTLDIEAVVKAGVVDTWLTLEGVKTGRLHVKARWLYISNNPEDHRASDLERGAVDFKSTALLMVTVDSAKDLPGGSLQSSRKAMIEPSPFVRMEVGNKEERSTIKPRSTNPYWAETFTFLVADLEQQELTVEVLDSSKENCRLGVRKIGLTKLLSCQDMTSSHPYFLKECATNSSITLRLCLRLLTNYVPADYVAPPTYNPTSPLPTATPASLPTGPSLAPQISSVGALEPPTPPSGPTVSLGGWEDTPNPVAKAPSEVHAGFADIGGGSESFVKHQMSAANQPDFSEGLRYRGAPAPASNEGRFGKIQITIRYSVQRERLIAVIHQCLNLIPCDSDNLADPYVKLYLSPDKSSKKKTQTQKNTLNPTFDETFDWHVSKADLPSNTLDITVKNNVGMFSKSRTVMGLLRLKLEDFDDLSKSYTDWFDLTDPDFLTEN